MLRCGISSSFGDWEICGGGVNDMYLEAHRDTVHSCVTRPSDGSGRREKKRRDKKRIGRV